jgi:hypothetical protein
MKKLITAIMIVIIGCKSDNQNMETMSFADAFSYNRKQYGSNHIFKWQGNRYTTILAEEIVYNLPKPLLMFNDSTWQEKLNLVLQSELNRSLSWLAKIESWEPGQHPYMSTAKKIYANRDYSHLRLIFNNMKSTHLEKLKNHLHQQKCLLVQYKRIRGENKLNLGNRILIEKNELVIDEMMRMTEEYINHLKHNKNLYVADHR